MDQQSAYLTAFETVTKMEMFLKNFLQAFLEERVELLKFNFFICKSTKACAERKNGQWPKAKRPEK